MTQPAQSPSGRPPLQIARDVVGLEMEALREMEQALDGRFEEAVALILERPGRVIVTGVGKSGIIGRKISATLASTGTTSYFLHAAEGLHGDLGIMHRDDVVLCLSRSGASDELNHLLPVFGKLNVPVIAVTSNLDSVLARHSRVVLNLGVTTEACPHGLAPTSSTTAMLVLGDALAIALLEQRGFRREDYAFLHPAGNLGRRLLVQVDDLMETDEQVAHVNADARMKEATLAMASKRGICAVLDGGRVIGVITTGDLNRLIERTPDFFPVPVTEVMNRTPKLVEEGTLAFTAYNHMEEHRIIAMPVVDPESRLKGMVHLHDIMRAGIF
ncbi:MAG: SIS domain-containing protein [Candidatus Hydrogenedentota bacterium]